MFYSALAKNQTRKHCIGSATSNNIIGPYTALDEPIVCDFEHGGVIDPAYAISFALDLYLLITLAATSTTSKPTLPTSCTKETATLLVLEGPARTVAAGPTLPRL